MVREEGCVLPELAPGGTVPRVGCEVTRLHLGDVRDAVALEEQVDPDAEVHRRPVDPDGSGVPDLPPTDAVAVGGQKGLGARLPLLRPGVPAPARDPGAASRLREQSDEHEDERDESDDDRELGIHGSSVPAIRRRMGTEPDRLRRAPLSLRAGYARQPGGAMAHRLFVLLAVLSTWLVGTAHARAVDCRPLKPEQRLSEQQAREVEAALRGGLAGTGRGTLGGGARTDHSVELQVLQEDDLARGWFLFQACVMKETGLIDEATAQGLVRHIMGMAPAAGPSVPERVGRRPAAETAPAAIRVVGRPSSAEIWIDGQPRGQLGEGRVLPVAPGRHRVAIKQPRYRTLRATVDVDGGTEEVLQLSGMTRRVGPGGVVAIWLGSTLVSFIGVSALGFWMTSQVV